MYVVPDIGALHPEDDVLGDVGGVIGNPLEIAGHEKGVQGLAHDLGAFVHGLNQLDESVVAHRVNHVSHFKYSLGQLNFAFNERLQGPAHHRAHSSAHARDIHRQLRGGKFDHIHHALCDVYRLIAHAFEIGVNFRYRQNETQVYGHGLLHGEQVKGRLIDFSFCGIDQAFAFEHHLATGKVALHIRLPSAIHRLLRQSSHAKQPLPQIVEPLLKTRAHYPNLSYPNLALSESAGNV